MKCAKQSEVKFRSVDEIEPDCYDCYLQMLPCTRINDVVVADIREMGQCPSRLETESVKVSDAEKRESKKPFAPVISSSVETKTGCISLFLDSDGRLNTERWKQFSQAMCPICFLICETRPKRS